MSILLKKTFSSALVMVACIIAAATAAAAQQKGVALSGQVIDAVTREVLDSVQVKVKGSELHATTGDDGSFSLDRAPGGKVALLISRKGYRSREVDVLAGAPELKWTVALWPQR